MRRENFLGGIWLRRGEEKEIVRARCFLPGLSKSFLPKIWRKLGGEKIRIGLTKMSMCTTHMSFVHTQCFFLPLAHTQFFCLKNVLLFFFYFFVLFNGDIIINLYQFHFHSLIFLLN